MTYDCYCSACDHRMLEVGVHIARAFVIAHSDHGVTRVVDHRAAQRWERSVIETAARILQEQP